MIRPHKSRSEALASVHHILEFIKTKENADVFFMREAN